MSSGYDVIVITDSRTGEDEGGDILRVGVAVTGRPHHPDIAADQNGVDSDQPAAQISPVTSCWRSRLPVFLLSWR